MAEAPLYSCPDKSLIETNSEVKFPAVWIRVARATGSGKEPMRSFEHLFFQDAALLAWAVKTLPFCMVAILGNAVLSGQFSVFHCAVSTI